jgi:hypothetical protein
MFIIGILTIVTCLTAAALDAFSTPFINPDLGDVVLFAFAVAGAGSGFIAGYGLRRLRAEKAERARAVDTTDPGR